MEALYSGLLTVHNLTRWLVLLAGVWALARVFRGVGGVQTFTATDRRAVATFAGTVHLQVVLGLLLFGLLGSQGARAFADGRPSFQWEHIGLGVVAAVFVTLASALSKRREGNQAKFRAAALWSALALVTILVGIPWWRPLLRLFS